MEQMAQCWLTSLLKLSSLVRYEMCQCQARTPPKEQVGIRVRGGRPAPPSRKASRLVY